MLDLLAEGFLALYALACRVLGVLVDWLPDPAPLVDAEDEAWQAFLAETDRDRDYDEFREWNETTLTRLSAVKD
jgi:hypothetical protein